MKIAFMGTGAIGASVARALHLNKIPFTILVRDKIRKVQLQTKGIDYEQGVRIQIPLADQGKVMPISTGSNKKFDYIFLGMKTIHLKHALPKALKFLSKNGNIILLQNGIPEEVVTGIRPERIISGIVGYNVQKRPDESYFQSNPGHLILATTGTLPFELKRALTPHMPVIITDNVSGYRWNKLAINSVINGLGAVTGLPLGQIFNNYPGRKSAILLVKETAQVMQELGIKEAVVPGAISVYSFVKKPALVQHLMLFFLGRKYSLIKTSMLQDIEKNLKTETDQIHGAIVRAAYKLGVQVPLTEKLMHQIHLLESKKARPEAGFCQTLIKMK